MLSSEVASARSPEPVLTHDADGRVVVRATRITQTIKIDGRLDEEVYREVSPVTEFIQQFPHEGAPATEKTQAWVLFDDKNLYIACRCLDEHPERIVANDMRRDIQTLSQQDHFAVGLDTTIGRISGPSWGTEGPFSDPRRPVAQRDSRHDLKTGGEYYRTYDPVWHCTWCQGVIDATGGPVPANIEQLFPVWNDVSTWNLAALSAVPGLVRSYRRGIGSFYVTPLENRGAAWAQDDWQITSRLTLNLGLRYDIISGMFAEDVSVPPFLTAGRPADKDNIQPRLGFAYSLTNRTVLRGGFGKYYGETGFSQAHWTNLWSGQVHPMILNDGRPNFLVDPYNGPAPTYEQAKARQALPLQDPRKYFSSITTSFAAPDMQVPYSYQSSIGVQRQIGDLMAVEANYAFTGTRHLTVATDINLAYNPATGYNYPFTDRTKKPYASYGWDQVSMSLTEAQDNYHALLTSFTRRMSNNWQASATYSFAKQSAYQRPPIAPGCTQPFTISASGTFVCDVPITLHPTLAAGWYGAGVQRNRLTVNGIAQLPYAFQLSGLFIYGDNGWATPSAGVDVFATGATTNLGSGSNSRVRANGTIIARNSFDLSSLRRLDLRVQRRFGFGRKAGIDGIFEVFNLFNTTNYGSWVTNESNARYGNPSDNNNVAYAPRMLQLGFRTTF